MHEDLTHRHHPHDNRNHLQKGCHRVLPPRLVYNGKESTVEDARHWQGTVVFLDLHSDQDFNPDEIAKDCVEEYDEMFLDDEDASLW